jgi:hypothetical protein
MEADWSVEIGAGLATIDVPWSGFVDISGVAGVQIGARVSEAAALPALAAALGRLNAAASPVFTSKCDTWPLDPLEIDRYEFDAEPGSSACGEACYIDVLARDAQVFASFTLHEVWVRAFASALSLVPLRPARAEMVLRAATLDGHPGFAVTLYAFGCGAEPGAARLNSIAALEAAVAATISTIPIAESKLGE